MPSQPEARGHQRPNATIEPRRNRSDERVKFASDVLVQSSDDHRAEIVDKYRIDVDEIPRHRLGHREEAPSQREPAFRPRLASEYSSRSPQYASYQFSTRTLPSRFRGQRVKPLQQHLEYDMDMRSVSKQRYKRGNSSSDVVAPSPSPHQTRLTAQVSPHARASSMSPSVTMVNDVAPVFVAPAPARNTASRWSEYNATGSSVASSSAVSGSRRDREEPRYRDTSSLRNQWQHR